MVEVAISLHLSGAVNHVGLRQRAKEFAKQGAEESWHTPQAGVLLLGALAGLHACTSTHRHHPLPIMQGHYHGCAPREWHILHPLVEWVTHLCNMHFNINWIQHISLTPWLRVAFQFVLTSHIVTQESMTIVCLKAIVAQSLMRFFFFPSPLSPVVKVHQQMFYNSASQHLWEQSAPLMQAMSLGRLLLASQGKRKWREMPCGFYSFSLFFPHSIETVNDHFLGPMQYCENCSHTQVH